VQREDHGVSRRAFDGPFTLGDFLPENRLAQRERLRRGAALHVRRHNARGAETFKRGDKRAQTFGVDSIVIRHQDIRHATLS